MAMLIQPMSAKFGSATALDLAELCRTHFPKPVVVGLWLMMELVAMATDQAEFLGAALGLRPSASLIILGLERYGFRSLEAVITSMVGVLALCCLVESAGRRSAAQTLRVRNHRGDHHRPEHVSFVPNTFHWIAVCSNIFSCLWTVLNWRKQRR